MTPDFAAKLLSVGEREAIDVNFAIHFPLFDRVFGTHHMPDNRWPDGYGVASEPVPTGYWKQFLYPFTRPTRPESDD